LLLVFGFLALALAGWTAVSNPALASILTLAMVTPTQAARPFWARAELPKAAYTPTPLPLPTVTQPVPALPDLAQSSTETAPTEMPLISAVIVEDPSIPASQPEQEAAPSVSYSGSKYILVDISEQHLYAYENGSLLYSFIASTGLNNATATGNFAVQSKIPNAYGSTWNIWMPNWLGIYWSGGLENGIHALPILPNGGILWEGFLGRPISYGCVVLGTYDSQLLFDWAEYGTPVDIQW
jgi:lipoprotein-anchoring transpeptidase ErfK/SrfK